MILRARLDRVPGAGALPRAFQNQAWLFRWSMAKSVAAKASRRGAAVAATSTIRSPGCIAPTR